MLDASDQSLLQSAQRGDLGALEDLLLRHQPRIYRFAMKMCGDPDDAADILQETLLALARSIRDLHGKSSLSTWLYTVARSFCIKKRRTSRFAPPDLHSIDDAIAKRDPLLADPNSNPENDAAGRQIQIALTRALATLEPSHREVVLLRDVEGLGAQDVAEILGIRVEAVKSRLHRARVALRAALLPLLGVDATEQEAGPSSCPDVLTMFSRHLEGEIDANLCAQMEEHLGLCPRCRCTCDSLRRTLSICQSSPAQPVPRDVQNAVRHQLRRLLSASDRS